MRSRGPRARLGSKDSKSNGAQLRHVRLRGKERMIKRRCFRNTTLDEVLADEGAASAERGPRHPARLQERATCSTPGKPKQLLTSWIG